MFLSSQYLPTVELLGRQYPSSNTPWPSLKQFHSPSSSSSSVAIVTPPEQGEAVHTVEARSETTYAPKTKVSCNDCMMLFKSIDLWRRGTRCYRERDQGLLEIRQVPVRACRPRDRDRSWIRHMDRLIERHVEASMQLKEGYAWIKIIISIRVTCLTYAKVRPAASSRDLEPSAVYLLWKWQQDWGFKCLQHHCNRR